MIAVEELQACVDILGPNQDVDKLIEAFAEMAATPDDYVPKLEEAQLLLGSIQLFMIAHAGLNEYGLTNLPKWVTEIS